MNKVLKNCCLFIIFGVIYGLIETIWKGHLTHWSMFILAGIAGTLIGSINEYISWKMPFFLQCSIGMIISTILEGLTGLIVNVWLNLHVWDYSNSFGRFFYNQCCLPFCAAWFILSGLCILLDDYIRWKFFNEEEPHYNLLVWKKKK